MTTDHDRTPAEARAVLDFWFADALASAEAAQARSAAWFRRDPAFDAEIASRFGDLPARAAGATLDHWSSSAPASLARVIALDQFPRNLYREDGRAFAFDERAQAIATAAIDAGFDQVLSPVECVFLYLPFEHAEERALQDRSVALFEALERRAPTANADLFASYSDYARRHRDVVARFGRFPHRNEMLGRPTTDAESAWLASGGDRFGGGRAR